MLFKLALKNVKKSYKDFTVYFLTLSLGVCIFYLFNSLESQSIMLSLDESQIKSIQNLSSMMNILSVFVSFVLGFLIIYASNFLITRRKKELGIYLILGMDRNHVSKVLVYETFVIGLMSLCVGLFAGFFFSHLLSIVTANMFAMKIESFKFVFSQTAAVKTVAYFGLIFIIVILFNVMVISKVNLIKLMGAKKQNHDIKTKNTFTSFLIFLMSVFLLAIAYYLVIANGFESIGVISIATILGALGTFLFFYAISGFFLQILKRNKRLYFSGLNSFIIRQFNSRINATFISTSIICLLLFLTIGILSTGASLTNSYNKGYDSIVPYDASGFIFNYPRNLEEELQKNTDALDVFETYHIYTIYKTKNSMKTILGSVIESDSPIAQILENMQIELIRLSDYNRLLELKDVDPLKLEVGQCYVLANAEITLELWSDYLESDNTVVLDGKLFTVINKVPDQEGIENSSGFYNSGIIVVNDDEVLKTDDYRVLISGNYKQEDLVGSEKKFLSGIESYNKQLEDYYFISFTREEYIQSTILLKISLSYIGIYLGVIFLIACSTILALIQLSEADDNIERYNLLTKLGASEEAQKKSLFISVFISFFTPLILAMIHSVFGIWWVNNTISLLGKINVLSSIIYTAIIIIIVYGGYFILTYYGVKRIVKK